MYLAKVYSKTVNVDRVIKLENVTQDSMVIMSKLNSIFSPEYFDQEFYDDTDHQIEMARLIEIYLVSFVNFIQLLDDVLIKGKQISKIQNIIDPIYRGDL